MFKKNYNSNVMMLKIKNILIKIFLKNILYHNIKNYKNYYYRITKVQREGGMKLVFLV